MSRERTGKWTAVRLWWGDGGPYRKMYWCFSGYSPESMSAFIEQNPHFFNPPWMGDVDLPEMRWRFQPVATWRTRRRMMKWILSRRHKMYGWAIIGEPAARDAGLREGGR